MLTILLRPSLLEGNSSFTVAKGHSRRFFDISLTSTLSPTLGSRPGSCHLESGCRAKRYSLSHLAQKSECNLCLCLHIIWVSFFLMSRTVSRDKLSGICFKDLPIIRCAGVMDPGSAGSSEQGAKGRLLTRASAWHISVVKESMSRVFRPRVARRALLTL